MKPVFIELAARSGAAISVPGAFPLLEALSQHYKPMLFAPLLVDKKTDINHCQSTSFFGGLHRKQPRFLAVKMKLVT